MTREVSHGPDPGVSPKSVGVPLKGRYMTGGNGVTLEFSDPVISSCYYWGFPHLLP